MSRLGKTEKIIFIGALIILMAFSYFLYDDSLLFPKTTNSELVLIGQVSVSQNDVRRKNLDTFSWIPASKKDEIYQNDSIFTGDRSQAIIQLNNGSQIKIEPNSLITLKLENGQMNLDLRYGNLTGEIAQGATLTVKSGTEEFKLEGDKTTKEKSKIQFNKAHSGTVDLKLLSGKVDLVDKKKQAKKELPKDATVAVAKGAVKEVAKPELVIKTPNNVSWVRVNPDDPLPFEWVGKGDISRYELEISSEKEFKTVTYNKDTDAMNMQVTAPLEPGAYFWHLKVYDKNGNLSITSPGQVMNITHLAPPEILTPVKAAEINLEMKVKGNEVATSTTQVTWKNNSSMLKKFKWQLAQDEKFEKILKEEETPGFAGVTPKLGSGTYYVRVMGTTPDNKTSPWSEAVPFTMTILAKKEERPAKPVLISKKIDFKPPTGNDRTPAAEQAPKMDWQPVLQVQKYHVQLSKDISFRDFESFDSTDTKVMWSHYKPGHFYYRVYARGVNGLLSEPSDVGIIDIPTTNPVLNPVESITNVGDHPGPKETAVSWTELPYAKSYLLEMTSGKDFTKAKKVSYQAASGKITLPGPGDYNVRVQAVDENNQPVSDFSNIQSVLYSSRPPLTSPNLMEPFNKASIFLQTEAEPFIWLEWRKVQGATMYTIEVSDKPDFSTKLISKTQVGNRFLLKEKVPLGRLYWRVRAESKETAELSQWTQQREFTIYHQKNETFVK